MRKRVKRFILKEKQTHSGVIAKWWVWDIKLSPDGKGFVWSWKIIVNRAGYKTKETGKDQNFLRLTDKEISKSLYKELKRVGYWDYILAEDLK